MYGSHSSMSRKLSLSSLLVISSIISGVNGFISLCNYDDQTGHKRIGVGRGVKVLIVTGPVDVDKVACQVLAVQAASWCYRSLISRGV